MLLYIRYTVLKVTHGSTNMKEVDIVRIMMHPCVSLFIFFYFFSHIRSLGLFCDHPYGFSLLTNGTNKTLYCFL